MLLQKSDIMRQDLVAARDRSHGVKFKLQRVALKYRIGRSGQFVDEILPERLDFIRGTTVPSVDPRRPIFAEEMDRIYIAIEIGLAQTFNGKSVETPEKYSADLGAFGPAPGQGFAVKGNRFLGLFIPQPRLEDPKAEEGVPQLGVWPGR